MRVLPLTLAVLSGIGAAVVAGNLRLVTVPTEPDTVAAPELVAPVAVTVAAHGAAGPAPRTEYCGETRLAVVRRVILGGERAAMLDILPPSRWEAWPDVVRGCRVAHGPLGSRGPSRTPLPRPN